jgi:DDE_Tnp_1-associated/Transposase DDE domain
MSSSPTYTVVDQFDEDEFPDIPEAPAALLATLRTVPDPRKPRGRRHLLPGILAIAACAVIAGARSFVAIAEWAAAATPAALAKLGVTGEVPCESTIRRTINQVDANGLDRIIGAWTALRAGNPKNFRIIAVDGKSVRGSATAGGRCRHLLAAFTHVSGLVLGQLDVDLKTNEIPMFSTLLDTIDLLGALVTADALHCQKDHAKYLVEQRGAHYLLTVKNNQPTLRNNSPGCPGRMSPLPTPRTTAATDASRNAP